MKKDKAHRRAVVSDANRSTETDARACLMEVVGSFAGQSHDQLAQRVGAPIFSRKVPCNGREYEVLVDVSRDVGPEGEHLLVNFQVDDGGRYLLPPITAWYTVSPGEVFTP